MSMRHVPALRVAETAEIEAAAGGWAAVAAVIPGK
jgi:hypothetical protein